MFYLHAYDILFRRSVCQSNVICHPAQTFLLFLCWRSDLMKLFLILILNVLSNILAWYQVAERSLFFWNNDHIVSLIAQNRAIILPIIYEALERNIENHWNPAVHGLTVNVQKMFMEMDSELFKECQRQYEERKVRVQEVKAQREITWKRLADAAAQRGGDDMITV